MRPWLAASIAIFLVGCECTVGGAPRGADPAPRPRPVEPDEPLAIAFPTPTGVEVPPASRFERLGLAEAEGAERARAWIGLWQLGAARAKRSPGNFVCRLHQHFGPPDASADGVRWAFRDAEGGAIVTAYVDEGGPAFGGVLAEPGEDEERRVTASVDALARLVDATRPIPCEVAIVTSAGATRAGVRDGRYYDEPAR